MRAYSSVPVGVVLIRASLEQLNRSSLHSTWLVRILLFQHQRREISYASAYEEPSLKDALMLTIQYTASMAPSVSAQACSIGHCRLNKLAETFLDNSRIIFSLA